jgi:serine/threonine protein phosphatase PrpC
MWNRDFQVVDENAAGGAFLLVGSAHGEGDSAKATKEAINKYLASSSEPFPQRMIRALGAANAALDHMNSHDVWEWKQNCVEVVSTWVADNAAHIAWLGNCRAYHLRGERIVAVTKEHSILSHYRDTQGPLTTEDERAFAYSHVVTRALGVATDSQPFEVEVRPESWSLQPGDKVLLCSRGVYLGPGSRRNLRTLPR